jgi:hypothetical protein
MALTLNGSNNTIGGLAVGGLPDGIVDTDMLAAGAVTAPKRGAGAILQVVQTVKTSYFTNASIDTIVDVTGASVDITPSSTSNKIYVTVSGAYSNGVDEAYGHMFLARTISGTTSNSICLGDASGSSSRATIDMNACSRVSGVQHGAFNFSIQYLDSPSTTSAVTYKLQVRGRYPSDFNVGIGGTYSTSDHNKVRVPTFITAMEVAG